MKIYFWIIILFIFCNSCTDDGVVPVLNNFADESSFLIPAKIGNYWVYVDSTITVDTVIVSIDTVFITNVDTINGEKWFKIEGHSSATSILLDKFLIRGDSIFTLHDTRGGSIIGLVFIPPTTDTTYYNMSVGGDAHMGYFAIFKHKLYSAPCGNFNSYALYFSDTWLEKFTYIIVPGVGIVKRIVEGIAYPNRPAFVTNSTLVKYYIPE